MNTNKKRFSLGWHVGLALGVVAGTGAAVYAVTIPNTFSDGQTASAAAVNANFQALKDAIDGCTTDMVRVGSSCVDKDAKLITDTTGCQPTGQGCAAATTGPAATATGVPFSWGQAVAACTAAGKRLATGREIISAHHSGGITVASGSYQYVDASAARDGFTYAGTFVLLRSDGTFELGGTQTPYTEQFPNTGANNIVAFRCAR